MNKQQRDKETWHFRGREARGQGKARELPDGRISLTNRQAFYDGWDTEDRLRGPKPTEAQVAAFNGFLSGLAAEVRSNIKA